MNLFELAAVVTMDSSEFDRGLEAVQGKTQGLGGALKSGLGAVGGAVAGAISTVASAAVDFAQDSVGVGMTFDAAMSNVQALTGATGSEFDDLRAKALYMGSTTSFSASEAADGMSELAKAGMGPRDVIDSIGGVMDLAAASGEGLALSANIVANGLNAFNMSAEESGHFADVLAVTATSAATDVGLLGETFKYIGPLAGTLNYKLEDVALATGLMANNNIVGSQSGTTLKTALSNLISPTESMTDVMARLGLVTKETITEYDSGKIESAQTKVANKTLDLQKAQVSYNEAIEKYGADSSQAQKALIAVEKAQNNLEEAQRKLADAQAGTTKEVTGQSLAITDEDGNMRSLSETLEILREKFAGLTEAEQAEAAATIFGKEAMSGMLAIINASDEDFYNLKDAIESADGAAQEMAEIKLDNLEGDIIKFQSALEGAQITLADQLNPTLRDFVQFGTDAISTLTLAFQEGGLSGAMEALGTILTDGLAMVIEKLPDVVDAGMQLLSALVQGISDNLPLVMTAAGDIIQIIGDGLIEYGPTLLENAAGIITTILGGITSGFPDLVSKAVEIIETLAHGISESLPQLIPLWYEMVATIGETITNPDNVASILHAGLEIIIALVDGFMDALPVMIAAAPVIISNLVDALIIALPEILSAGIQIIMALIDGIIGAVPELVAAIPVLMISLVEGIIANLDQIVVAAVEIILALAGGLIGALPQLIMIIPTLLIEIGKAFLDYDWLGIGRDLIDGIKNGVTNAWTSFIAHIKEAFQGLIDLVKGLFGIHSPSTVFAEIGGSLIEGFLNGIQAMWETVTTAVTALIEGLIGLFTGAWTGIETAWSAAGEFFAGVWKDIGDAFTGVVEFFGELFGDAWQAIQDVWAGVTEFFGGIWTTITEAFGDVAGWFSETFGGAWQAIQDAWTGVTEFFSGIWQDIQAAFDGVAEWFEGIFQDANELIQGAWADVTTFFTGVWTDISGAFEKADEWFETKFKDARDKAAAMWENAQEKFETAYGKIKGVFEKADEWFETKFKDGRDKAVKAWGNAKQKFDTVWTNIKSAFKPSQFTQVGKDLLTGLWNGIKDKVSWLQQQVSGVVDTIKGWFTGKKGFNTHSPSKWAQSVFENVMLGAGLGLADGENGVEKQAGKVISGIKSALTDVDFGDMGLTSALENARSGLDRAFVEETGYVRGGEWSGGGRGYGQQTTYNVTINSPKAMDEKEAARQFRRQSQRLARGMA